MNCSCEKTNRTTLFSKISNSDEAGRPLLNPTKNNFCFNPKAKTRVKARSPETRSWPRVHAPHSTLSEKAKTASATSRPKSEIVARNNPKTPKPPFYAKCQNHKKFCRNRRSKFEKFRKDSTVLGRHIHDKPNSKVGINGQSWSKVEKRLLNF